MGFYAKPSIADLYRSNLEEAKIEIMSAPDRLIEETDIDDLVEHFSSKYTLTPISIDQARQSEAKYKKRIELVPAHRRDEGYRELGDTQFEFESIRFTVPFIHNEDIRHFAALATSTMSINWSIDQYEVTPDAISVEFDIKGYGFDYKQADQASRMLEDHRNRMLTWIGRVNADIARENPNLKNQLAAFVNERKAKLEKDKHFIAELNRRSNTPIRVEDSETARKIMLNTAPLVKKVAPRPSAPPEFELDQQLVMDIIAFIDNQGRQFERTPKSYADHDETTLRNTLLVVLNAIFSGKATGETFSNKGKTDIYLNIEKGNILIFECKIWGGQVLYHATIDQLIGYLTWRHNFGIIVTFMKKKNFGAILETIPQVITSHPAYVNGLGKLNDTHFVSNHRLPQDESKTVEIHHLFYNLYSE